MKDVLRTVDRDFDSFKERLVELVRIPSASDDEITVFDSTGVALQDVAAAALVYERAEAAGRGLRFDLGA